MQCMLDMTARDARGFNSSNLMFYRADEVVPREQVKVNGYVSITNNRLAIELNFLSRHL